MRAAVFLAWVLAMMFWRWVSRIVSTSAPLLVSPTALRSGSAESNAQMPLRSIVWSSAGNKRVIARKNI